MSIINEILQNAGVSSTNVYQINAENVLALAEKIAALKAEAEEQAKRAKETETLYAPNETTQKLRISRSTLQRWEKSGFLNGLRIGGQLRYRQQDIDRILNKANQ